MDLGSAVVGIVILIVCTIPFALISINSRKKEKLLLQGLNEFAESNHCKISRYEIWYNSTIGIDDTANVIFFKRKANDSEISQQIKIVEIQNCKVINTSRTVNQREGNIKVVDKLEMLFIFKDKNKKDKVIEFYNTNHGNLTLTGELQLVEKWSNIFNDKISEQKG